MLMMIYIELIINKYIVWNAAYYFNIVIRNKKHFEEEKNTNSVSLWVIKVIILKLTHMSNF